MGGLGGGLGVRVEAFIDWANAQKETACAGGGGGHIEYLLIWIDLLGLIYLD